MQRPWGRDVHGMFEEEHGGLCGWRKVNERKSVSLVAPDEPHQPFTALSSQIGIDL